MCSPYRKVQLIDISLFSDFQSHKVSTSDRLRCRVYQWASIWNGSVSYIIFYSVIPWGCACWHHKGLIFHLLNLCAVCQINWKDCSFQVLHPYRSECTWVCFSVKFSLNPLVFNLGRIYLSGVIYFLFMGALRNLHVSAIHKSVFDIKMLTPSYCDTSFIVGAKLNNVFLNKLYFMFCNNMMSVYLKIMSNLN